MSLDLSRQFSGPEANIDVKTVAEPVTVTSKRETKAKKEAKKEAKKLKDKKKSKKGKKKSKEKKGTLSKHLWIVRSVSSCSGSQRSFGSQRSLGSYGSEWSMGERSFVSFISLRDDASVSRRSTIRKRAMAKGSRKVPLVSMPEHPASPDHRRKAFNDNAFNTSFRSIENFSTSFRKSHSVVSPLHATKSLLQEASTPITATESPSSKIGTEYLAPITPRLQMVPKSQSFSY
jgi:hypothetical protein